MSQGERRVDGAAEGGRLPARQEQLEVEDLRQVVESGEAWLSGTMFGGRRAIRLSVSNWQTGEDDIARALAAFRAAAA